MRKFPNINLVKRKTALERLKELGTVVKISTESPHFINHTANIYLVHFGLVDVFYMRRNREGRILSPRMHLHAVERNQMLLPIGSNLPDGTQIDLLAVSNRAELLFMEKSVFFSFLQENSTEPELLRMIGQWSKSILHHLNISSIPRNCTVFKHESPLQLLQGQNAYPLQGEELWGRLASGEVSYMGLLPLQEGAIFPLSHQGWIHANSDATLELYGLEALASSGYLVAGLEHLAVLRAQILQIQVEKRYLSDESLLREQIEADRFNITNASAQFAAILNKTQTYHTDAKDALTFACQIVGQQLGTDITVPNNLEAFDEPLEAIASHSKLRKRKVMLRESWWLQENGHLLAFSESDLPVALIQKNGYYLATDGVSRKTVRVTEEYAQRLKPIAYMFFKPFGRPITSVKQLWEFAMQGLGADVKLMGLVAFAGALLGLIMPVLMGLMMDDIIPLSDMDYLLETVGVMIVLAIVNALLLFTQSIFIIRIEIKGTLNSQAALMDHLLRLPIAFFKQYTSGDLANRALSINKIRQILSHSVLQVLLKGTFSLVNLGLLFYYQSKLAWLGVALAAIALATVGIIGYRKLIYNREMADIQGKLQGQLFEFLSGMIKIKGTGIEAKVYALWGKIFTKQKEASFKTVSEQNKLHLFANTYPLLTNILFFFFIYYQFKTAGTKIEEATGIPENIAHQLAFASAEVGITVGAFLAFITAFRQFLTNTLQTGELLIESLEVVPHYERLKPLLEAHYESDDKAVAKPLRGGIEMSHLKFRYEKEGTFIINDLSLNIAPDQLVAFVGESGSGKSTLMRLLLGFEQAESGAIYYDGQDLAHLKLSSVRNQIGVVLQDGALTPSSIFDNIVGTHNLTLDDAWEAARKVGLEDDIKQMPMGMNTILGEGASSLSGGQRQRLMIARAIVHNPRILFFDEATSALDNHTQKTVTESLDQLQATRIVIAHRLSTIKNADCIFVLQKGKIIEKGTYEELMGNYGYFYELAQRQTV